MGTLIIKNGPNFHLSDYNNLLIVGAGKATARMARAIEEIMANVALPVKGIISIKHGHGVALRNVKTIEASHPIPGSKGLQAANEIVKCSKRYIFCQVFFSFLRT